MEECSEEESLKTWGSLFCRMLIAGELVVFVIVGLAIFDQTIFINNFSKMTPECIRLLLPEAHADRFQDSLQLFMFFETSCIGILIIFGKFDSGMDRLFEKSMRNLQMILCLTGVFFLGFMEEGFIHKFGALAYAALVMVTGLLLGRSFEFQQTLDTMRDNITRAQEHRENARSRRSFLVGTRQIPRKGDIPEKVNKTARKKTTELKRKEMANWKRSFWIYLVGGGTAGISAIILSPVQKIDPVSLSGIFLYILLIGALTAAMGMDGTLAQDELLRIDGERPRLRDYLKDFTGFLVWPINVTLLVFGISISVWLQTPWTAFFFLPVVFSTGIHLFFIYWLLTDFEGTMLLEHRLSKVEGYLKATKNQINFLDKVIRARKPNPFRTDVLDRGDDS